MSRRWQQPFKCQPLDDLTRQLVRSPAQKRIEQVRRAEALHDELEPDKGYPYDFLTYRLTGFRSDSADALLLIGDAAKADLRLMIDTLSRSVEMPLRSDESACTPAELAHRFGVSTKTVSRWRALGLRWRWVRPADGGRKTVVFVAPAVDRFVAEYGDRIERASGFRPMPDEERRRIIARARRIASRRDASLNRVATHLARRTDRALETVRLILEKHDRRHPDRRIFTGQRGPLKPRQKKIIERAHRMGVATPKIAERFGRTRSTIYRAIHERRAGRIRRLRLSCIDSPTFDRPDADEVILDHPIESINVDRSATRTLAAAGLPEALAKLYDRPAVADKPRRSLFVRYNYLKHKAIRIRDGLDPYEPRAGDLDRFDSCVKDAAVLRNLLVRSHLPAVLSVARRQQLGQQPEIGQLMRLLEIGNGVLIEAVESYNAGRPATFDSYLTNLLLRRFVIASSEDRSRARQRIDSDEACRRLLRQIAILDDETSVESTGEASEP